MWWNIIGDAGAEALTRSLLLNRTLRELKVLVNTIGEAGCQALQDVQDAKRQRGETFFIEGLEGQRRKTFRWAVRSYARSSEAASGSLSPSATAFGLVRARRTVATCLGV
eukprot:s2222_g8.t1